MKVRTVIPSFVLVVVILLSIGNMNAYAATTKTITDYRGSCALWMSDKTTWTYNGKKIIESACEQNAGQLGLDTVSKEGATIYRNGGTTHYTYTSSYLIGVGIPSPWGTQNAWSSDVDNIIDIYSNGTSNVKFLNYYY